MKEDAARDWRHCEEDQSAQLTRKEDEFFQAVANGAPREVIDRLFAEVEVLRVSEAVRRAGN